MPIKPPRLDDRRFDDLVREARALIPQYCPEWTNLSDADPGMTLVQLFAWMTEMTLYRLNRVPDKTYVHFLNFIGEERRTAAAATAPLTLSLRQLDRGVVDVPAFARFSTRQRSGGEALHFLTEELVSVHAARLQRAVVVAAGPTPLVRELPLVPTDTRGSAYVVGDGQGVSLFQLDPVADGARSYTADQVVYLRHDDLLRMPDVEHEGPGGTLRLRSAGDGGLPVAALFDWARPLSDGSWRPVQVAGDPQLVVGLPEVMLRAELPDLAELSSLGSADDPIPWPEDLPRNGWIRGQLRFERWLVGLMEEELRITWRDDRGGEERELTNWLVRHVGRTIEWFVQNLPPLRAGWTLRLKLVDHGMPVGHGPALPEYRFSYRRGNQWVPLPSSAVEQVDAGWVIAGPLTEMATDGFNLRAERVSSVDVLGILPDLQADLVWRRPIDLWLASGPEASAAARFSTTELPREPFQPLPTLPALLGMKLFVGSDLLANRARRPVLLELEVGFEREGEPVEEPVDDYHLQLTYRTSSGWQTVHGTSVDFARFTFADLDPDGARRPERRVLRVVLDPMEHVQGITPVDVAGRTTCWLRLELTRAALSWQPDKKTPPVPVSLRLYNTRLSLRDAPGALTWDEQLPGTRVVAVEHRSGNRRFTRLSLRRGGAVVQELPFDDFIALDDGDGPGHRAVYLRLDRPLPVAKRLATMFLCQGESFVPPGFHVQWELLQAAGAGGVRWTRVAMSQPDGSGAYRLDRTGVLSFALEEAMTPAPQGVWLRGVLRRDGGGPFPALPPVTHVLLNTVMARNLHGFRMERFSGEGVPHQVIQLRHFPVHVPSSRDEAAGPRGLDKHAELVVQVDEGDGDPKTWRVALGNALANASKDDRVFQVDPVEGTLTFGNGIRGRILPIGAFNVTVVSYHTVPGAAGNVGADEIVVSEGFADLVDVANVLPAHGGRNAESIDEIIRRAPSILSSRDRAVTRRDFEVIAEEASSEVARAACLGGVGADGGVEVVILPRRRDDEEVPDPFLAAGLKDHVQSWLQRRCIVNVQPRVRLATFQPVDLSLVVRARPHANPLATREAVVAWVRRFLDPYEGGLDGGGWPFHTTIYAQDIGRLVRDVTDVRHVVDVRLFLVEPPASGLGVSPPGWEIGQGAAALTLRTADLPLLREVRVRLAEELT